MVDGPDELLLELGADVLVNQDALSRHADLAGVEEGTEGALHSGVVQIGILPDNGGGLATELEEDRLEVLTSKLADDASDEGAAGEVDLLDIRVGDKAGSDGGRVGGLMNNHVQDTSGQASLVEDGAETPHGTGTKLGSLENGSVASGDGEQDGTDTKDIGGVPRLGQCIAQKGVCKHIALPRSNGEDSSERLLENEGAKVGVLGSRESSIKGSNTSGHVEKEVPGRLNVEVSPLPRSTCL